MPARISLLTLVCGSALVASAMLSACRLDDGEHPRLQLQDPLETIAQPADQQALDVEPIFDGMFVGSAGRLYPTPQRDQLIEPIHGQQIADPYRWMEDPDAPGLSSWIEQQNEITFAALGKVEQRDAIHKRLTEMWDFERFRLPQKEAGKYFYARNDGLQNQDVIYVADRIHGEGRVLLDPNTFSDDGTLSVEAWAPSEDGRYLGYAVSDGGSDWRTIYVLDVETGEKLPDTIEWAKFSGIAWAPDSSGFYYNRYDAPEEGAELTALNFNQKVYFHPIGMAQADDRLVHADPDNPDWGWAAGPTEDGDYLIIYGWRGTAVENLLYYQDLANAPGETVKLLNDWDADYTFIGNEGSTFFIQTDLDAPKGRVIAIDVTNPGRENWIEIIGEAEETLDEVSYTGGKLIANYLKDAYSSITTYNLDGTQAGEVKLPGIGTASGFGGEADDPETFYSFSSFTDPGSIYRYDVASGISEVWRKPDVDFDPAPYVTRQVFFTSRDGTEVPMFLVHREGIELDGSNPTLLYGYGGFNIPLTPGFSITRAVWLEMGGVYAVANLRGGGEYGEAWHEAGSLDQKQNTFDDFIAAAEWLIREGYTSPKKLAIQGGSNGGLLVGACMTQRPELFGACLPAVGVMDMLRFHKYTAGRFWVSDYGDPENPDNFAVLLGYSPYHNLEEGVCYPPTLITTADRDDRVAPMHSFKFAAELQRVQACDNPALIRIETRAGHGAGKPTAKRIDEAADVWAFLAETLRMDVELEQ
ncbi:MAG: prolyl oligopeptidase family protein [Phycisphaerales bacterium JB039]